MKELSKYIVEKLDINDINLTDTDILKHPIFDVFINLLESRKFNKKTYIESSNVYECVKKFNKYKGRYFEATEKNSDNRQEIVFADTTNNRVNFNNYLFILQFDNNNEIYKCIRCSGVNKEIWCMEFEDFINEMKKYFNL